MFSHLPLYIFTFTGLYFQIFLLVTFLEKGDESTKNREPNSYPSVSITVPCFNEERTVTGTLLSLLALDYPKDKLTLLVIDDGSTDQTYSIVKELTQKYPQIKLVQQPNGGKYTALNRGIKETQSELVGGLDADSFVDPQALKRMVVYFEDPKVMAVTPAIRVHNPKNVLQYMQRVEYNLGIFAKNMLSRMNAIHITPGPFSIFRKKVFDNLGPYRHAHNTEDMEIAFRMQENGYTIVNCPNAFVFTVTPPAFWKLHVQRVRWLSGFLKNSLDYKHLFFKKKYGTMSMLVLPFALLSIVASLYLAGLFLYYSAHTIYRMTERIRTIGFSYSFHVPHFDWFFMNTATITLIALVVFALTLGIILMGKKMAEGSGKPSLDILYFFLLYGLISPLWFAKSVYNTVASRKVPWR